MLLSKAKSHFGSYADIARALGGDCHQSAVYQWQSKGVIPMWAAQKLVTATGGQLQVDLRLYDAKGKPLDKAKPKSKPSRKPS